MGPSNNRHARYLPDTALTVSLIISAGRRSSISQHRVRNEMADSPGSRRRQPHASQQHSQQQASTSTESTNSSARPDRDNEGLTRRRSSSPSKAGMTSTAATPGAGESSSSAASSKARPDRKRPSSPAWDEAASSSGNPGEESMILRRREANRLAAQRFRNRKKGYQDSLEERIRVLEEERAILNRRLEDAEEGHAGRGYHGPHGGEHLMRRFDQSPSVLAGAPGRSASTSRLSRFASPSAADAELRVASLESANRRLQDELKRASERISYLESNLDQWVKWEQNLRYQSADAAGDIVSPGFQTLDANRIESKAKPSTTFSKNICTHSFTTSITACCVTDSTPRASKTSVTRSISSSIRLRYAVSVSFSSATHSTASGPVLFCPALWQGKK